MWTVKQNSEVTEKYLEESTLGKEVDLQQDAEMKEHTTWTIVGASKHKENDIVNKYTTNGDPSIGCNNGFDVLGVGDDPNLEDKVP